MKIAMLGCLLVAAIVGTLSDGWVTRTACVRPAPLAAPAGAVAVATDVAITCPSPVEVTELRSDASVPTDGVMGQDAACSSCERLRRELALALMRLEHPESDPWGHFLRSYEAEQITDARELSRLRALLEEFPVFLRPGEGTWIVERFRNDDWKAYGDTVTVALVRYLGPTRILAEGSEELIEYLEYWLDDAAWQALFGTPPPE